MALFQKKMQHQVTENTWENHIAVMRANYQENRITSKSLPKPLWLRLHKHDALHVIYRDKDLLFQNGQIYFAYLIQANDMLFEDNNKLELPANVLFSTHPVAEKYPELLMEIGDELSSYKNMPESEIPEHFREIARILTAETDRSGAAFSVSMPNPDRPDEMLGDIDLYFCSVIVFPKDLPHRVLDSPFLPVLAAPDQTPAVLILPKEYWSAQRFTPQ